MKIRSSLMSLFAYIIISDILCGSQVRYHSIYLYQASFTVQDELIPPRLRSVGARVGDLRPDFIRVYREGLLLSPLSRLNLGRPFVAPIKPR